MIDYKGAYTKNIPIRGAKLKGNKTSKVNANTHEEGEM